MLLDALKCDNTEPTQTDASASRRCDADVTFAVQTRGNSLGAAALFAPLLSRFGHRLLRFDLMVTMISTCDQKQKIIWGA